MTLSWAEKAWQDYVYWQQTNKKTLRRINAIIKDIQRQPFSGFGDPEPLKHNWSGYWSRRIDHEHGLVYAFDHDAITVIQCRYHYVKK